MERDTRSSGSIYGEAEMSDDRMCMATFQLSAIQGEKYICGAHISITDKAKRELWADDIFQFLDTVYDGSGELRSFQDMSIAPCLWYVTYDGEQPESLEELDVRKVYVVSVFRHDHGLKMAGIARRKVLPDEKNRSANIELRRNVKAALYEHIRFTAKVGWAEVSGQLEKYFHKALTIYDIIDPYVLQEKKIYKDMGIDIDGFHYDRPLCKGEEPVRMIAYGNSKI